jgi:carbamoyltransferase
MLILGLSPLRHHSSAALLEDGAIKAAIENHKLVRSESQGLPESSVRFCLETARIHWNDLDVIAMVKPSPRDRMPRSLLNSQLAHMASLASGVNDSKEIGRAVNDLRCLAHKASMGHKICNLDHHLCHAACSFFLSPFERALIFTADGNKDGNCGIIAVGEGTQIKVLQEISFPNSLAWMYSQITSLLGFVPLQEEHKTQWLSLEGKPILKDIFVDMFRSSQSPLPHLNQSFFEGNIGKSFPFSDKFYRSIGVSPGQGQLSEDQCRTLASSIQEACVELVSDLVEDLRRRDKVTAVCFAGGLFQNALLVSSLEKNLGLDQVFVPPAPGNAGTAVGAVYLTWHHVLRKPRTDPVTHTYWGPKFSGQQVKDVLDNCKARYTTTNTEQRKLDAIIQLLQSGKIVGWAQGACEFGPRALGNRSVLASPWAPYVKENLNDYIKFRESFRPFAISVPAEDCHRYFDCSQLCRFMNSVGWAHASDNCLPDTLLLPGGRVRLHVVERKSNSLFWLLLKRFGELAPAPMLINTSFNLFGEPLVVTPRDAVRSYFCSGIDALVVGNFVLAKPSVLHLLKPASGMETWRPIVPVSHA